MTEVKLEPEREAPLESWKEIAAYLNRDVRTVKRWEKNEGLPVHRHQHLARAGDPEPAVWVLRHFLSAASAEARPR